MSFEGTEGREQATRIRCACNICFGLLSSFTGL